MIEFGDKITIRGGSQDNSSLCSRIDFRGTAGRTYEEDMDFSLLMELVL